MSTEVDNAFLKEGLEELAEEHGYDNVVRMLAELVNEAAEETRVGPDFSHAEANNKAADALELAGLALDEAADVLEAV